MQINRNTLFSLILVLLLCPVLVWGQAETGQIGGTITDPSGAVIPNAKVTIKNLSTQATRSSTTTGNGTYVFPNVLPAEYEVTTEAAGFSTKQARISLAVGSRATLDFAMEVGQTDTIIQVSEAATQVNVETQTLGTQISTKQVLELPSLTRNPYDFVAVSGNVSPGDPSGRGVGYAMNGQRAASTGVLLDGAQNTDDFRATVGISVPLDSVQEYSILTSNFTPEFGRAGGGVVNVVTKSGSNAFHGTAYWFNRVSRLTANSFNNNANKLPKPVFTRNQFGGSIGGPIKKDKLFFFANVEPILIRSAGIRTLWVPTDQFINAASPNTRRFYSTYGKLKSGLVDLGTQTKNQLIASGFNPCAGGAAGGACAAFDGNTPMWRRISYSRPADSGGGTPGDEYLIVGRVDWNVSERTQIYGRWSRQDFESPVGANADSPYAGFDTSFTTKNDSWLVSMVNTLSPTVVSQSKATFNRLGGLNPLGDQPPTPGMYMRTTQTTMLGNLIAMPGYLPFNPGSAIPFGGPQNFLQLAQDLSVIKGSHQFRMGGNFNYLQDNRTFGAYMNSVQTLGTNFGNAVDNFLTGFLRQFNGAIDPKGKFPCKNLAAPTADCILTLPVSAPSFSRSNRYKEFAFYFNDTWRVNRRLTLNLGVRYEYFGVQRSSRPELESNYYDAAAGSIFTAIRNGEVATTPNSPVGGLWKPDWNNFAPRLGLAWDVTGDGKTSLRVGYGMAYERNFGNVTFNVIQNPPNYGVLALIAGADIPTIPISTDNSGPLSGSTGQKAFLPVSLRNVDSNIRTAYVHFWSGALERQVANGLVGAIEYSGSSGKKLYSLEDVNRVGYGHIYLGDPCTPGAGSPGNCTNRIRTNQYSAFNRRSGKGFSDYHGVNFRMDINKLENWGALLKVNYTFSKAIDNLSSTFSESNNNFNLGLLDPFNPRLDKGLADFDIRHRFVLGGTWDIPIAKTGSGLMKAILGGWTAAPILTMNSGTPYTIFDCSYAYFAVCPRAMFDGAVPYGQQEGNKPNGSVPNSFIYYDLKGMPINNNWYNPVIGTSEAGPWPANMSGRNRFAGPGFFGWDLGLYKNFQLTERVRMQFRSEYYSFLNHPNLRLVGGDADTSSTTIITGTRGGGDNRNIQLALKFIF